ncbi:PucR family transcriptional regulator [Nonomuraea cavernae]|uniref:PucR family transcriptional regulator n=1 Tax=Nonomuraea cavernae TaxID=2045107 RepID=UPI00166E50B0|nr:helix-turn-helix domain-containing protein [Nonomuraea cavernae]MCA2184332.1 helix-turn-helix domain-containing protein [Nonomuraea cavernae]
MRLRLSTLGRILDDLGSTFLDIVASPGEMDVEVATVQIYDPLDDQIVPPGTILLGVGVEGADRIRELLTTLGPMGAAGLVVKSPVAVDETVRAKVLETGVVLLGLTRAASWAQVAALLRSILAEGDVGSPGEPAGSGDDLFTLANAVCELLDAPITIEDRSSRVLAFSGRQDEADQARVETVLGRKVPEKYQRLQEERGIYRELYQNREPIFFDLGGGMLPRTAIAVRAGDEILGSMWATVPGPLPEHRRRAFGDAAKIVALHLLRQRAGADAQRRLRADLLSTVLEGGRDAADAAARLGIATERVCVLAAGLDESAFADVAGREGERQRFCDALALHVGAIHPHAAAALIGSVAYAVLPLHAQAADAEQRAVRVAESFLARTGRRFPAAIGVGRQVGTLAEVGRSRSDAARTLRVLRARGVSGVAAAYADVYFESLLLQLGDLVAAEEQPPAGPYEKLVAYDAEHGTDLVGTLKAYLDALGNVHAAAKAVQVHQNTFRYRLRRLATISGLDLDDPDARLAVSLQMRLHS